MKAATAMNKIVRFPNPVPGAGSMVNLLTINPSLRELHEMPGKQRKKRLMTAKAGG